MVLAHGFFASFKMNGLGVFCEENQAKFTNLCPFFRNQNRRGWGYLQGQAAYQQLPSDFPHQRRRHQDSNLTPSIAHKCCQLLFIWVWRPGGIKNRLWIVLKTFLRCKIRSNGHLNDKLGVLYAKLTLEMKLKLLIPSGISIPVLFFWHEVPLFIV